MNHKKIKFNLLIVVSLSLFFSMNLFGTSEKAKKAATALAGKGCEIIAEYIKFIEEAIGTDGNSGLIGEILALSDDAAIDQKMKTLNDKFYARFGGRIAGRLEMASAYAKAGLDVRSKSRDANVAPLATEAKDFPIKPQFEQYPEGK